MTIKIDLPVKYYNDPHIDGFVAFVGDAPMFVICGEVNTEWSQVIAALRFGWRIVGGHVDGTITVKR